MKIYRKESPLKERIYKNKSFKVQKLHHRIDIIRTDYINKTIAEIVKTKPSYITIEDLNVKGMMKNRHLSKAVASQKFYEFRIKLQAKMNKMELNFVWQTDGIHLLKPAITAKISGKI